MAEFNALHNRALWFGIPVANRDRGGQAAQDLHAIGPHGCRALLHDSEGNRIAPRSSKDL